MRRNGKMVIIFTGLIAYAVNSISDLLYLKPACNTPSCLQFMAMGLLDGEKKKTRKTKRWNVAATCCSATEWREEKLNYDNMASHFFLFLFLSLSSSKTFHYNLAAGFWIIFFFIRFLWGIVSNLLRFFFLYFVFHLNSSFAYLAS